MAGYESIMATCRSIARLLNHCFQEQEPHPVGNTQAILIRTEDLETGPNATGVLVPPALSIFLYRVDCNRPTRAAWSAIGHQSGRAHLPLELYFLLTPWAENAEYEYRILGRAMQCLETEPILSGPLLDPSTDWSAGDAIQISLTELTMEEVMRTFDSLPVDYKLSVPYMARVLRLDSRDARITPAITEVTIDRPTT